MKTVFTKGPKRSPVVAQWNGANGTAIGCFPLPQRMLKIAWQTDPYMISTATAAPVLKWVAPRAGKVRIEGTASVENANVGEWIAVIKHNAQEVWSSKTPSATASTHDVTVTVQAGDALHFIAKRPAPTPVNVFWNPAVRYEE